MEAADLIHRYSFDLGFTDSAGHSDGLLIGGASVSGGLLLLPGGATRTNYASLPPSVMDGLHTASFEGWFSVDEFNSFSKVFMAGEPDLTNYLEFCPSRYGSGVAPSTTFSNPGQGEIVLAAEDVLQLHTPYYFAAIFDVDAEAMSLYLGHDGTLSPVSTQSVPGLDLQDVSYSQFFLGASVGWLDHDLHGSVDEFRIWNGALTPAELSGHYAAGATVVPEPGTAALLGPALVPVFLRRRRSWAR